LSTRICSRNSSVRKIAKWGDVIKAANIKVD
jgi:hypothetical protein